MGWIFLGGNGKWGCVRACVCVCVRERERETETETETETERLNLFSIEDLRKSRGLHSVSAYRQVHACGCSAE